MLSHGIAIKSQNILKLILPLNVCVNIILARQIKRRLDSRPLLDLKYFRIRFLGLIHAGKSSQYGLLHMEPILCLVKYYAAIPFQHICGNFLAGMGRQAVHKYGVF